MSRPALVSLLTAFAMVACAAKPTATPRPVGMEPRDPQGLSLSIEAEQQLFSMMTRAIREQKEPAACVASYRWWFEDSTRKVDIYSLTLAKNDSSDELTIWAHGPMCPVDAPVIHGHVSRQWIVGYPSPVDWSSMWRLNAPFNLIFYRIDNDTAIGVTLYWKDGWKP